MFTNFGSIKTTIRLNVLKKEDRSPVYVYLKSPAFIKNSHMRLHPANEYKYLWVGANVPDVRKVYYNKNTPSMSHYMSSHYNRNNRNNTDFLKRDIDYFYSKYIEYTSSNFNNNMSGKIKLLHSMINYLIYSRTIKHIFMYQDFLKFLRYLNTIDYADPLQTFQLVNNIKNVIQVMSIGKPKILSIEKRLVLYLFEPESHTRYNGLSQLFKSLFTYNHEIKKKQIDIEICKESISIYKTLTDEDLNIPNNSVYAVYFSVFKDYVLDLNFFSFLHILQRNNDNDYDHFIVIIKITNQDKKMFIYQKQESDDNPVLLKVIQLYNKQIKHIKRQQHIYEGKMKP